ncbi:MAG: enoyl-CoA hydratase-related protein, partial [Gemmatimonadaceae bacterium]
MTVGAHEVITGTALSAEVDNGIAIVTLDVPGASVNTLSRAVVEEFSDLFDRVDKDLGIRALVLMSGKPEGFIAGADIEQFLELRSAREAELMSRAGQAMMDRVERLRAPVVAAIHGACLGGGLETVLA